MSFQALVRSVVLPAIANGTDFGSQTVSGGLGGLQVGCNYQVANWVFGIQGDYDWVGANGDGSNTGAALGFGFGAVTNHVDIRSLASVTGRVGYAWGRFLGYVKGGGAWVRDDYSLQSVAFLGGLGTFATASETRGGWTLGIGGEYAFLDWLTGFAEYDYYGFGTKTNNFNCTALLVCAAFVPTTFGVDIKQNVNVFKVGAKPQVRRRRRLRLLGRLPASPEKSGGVKRLRHCRSFFCLRGRPFRRDPFARRLRKDDGKRRAAIPAICDLQGNFQKLQGEPIYYWSICLSFQDVGRSSPGLRSREKFLGLQGGIANGGRVARPGKRG